MVFSSSSLADGRVVPGIYVSLWTRAISDVMW
jgi:hypothetical protein